MTAAATLEHVAAIDAARLPCEADPELFWPLSGISNEGKAQIAAARAVCRACPVRRQCEALVESWPKSWRTTGQVVAGVFYPVGRDQYPRYDKAAS